MLGVLEIEVFQIPGGRKTVRVDKPLAICGRSAKCDVVVRDPDVSRRHLRIELVNGELWAEDMGSSNGSTLDGEPLAERSRFQEGQVLRVCDHEIRVSIMQPAAEISTEHAPPMPMSNPAASQHTAATQHHEQQPQAQPQPQPQPQAQAQTPEAPQPQAQVNYSVSQVAHQLLVAPAPGRVEVPEDNPVQQRSFECGETMWQSFEHMARESGVPVDDLLNDALALYGRKRVWANAGSANQPQTSLQFTHQPPNNFDLTAFLKR